MGAATAVALALLLTFAQPSASDASGSCAPSVFMHDTQLKCTPGGNIVLHAKSPSPAACCALWYSFTKQSAVACEAGL